MTSLGWHWLCALVAWDFRGFAVTEGSVWNLAGEFSMGIVAKRSKPGAYLAFLTICVQGAVCRPGGLLTSSCSAIVMAAC